MKQLLTGTAILLLMQIANGGAYAQTLNRDALPIPDPAFKGQIGRTIEESKPDYPQPVRAPAGAPNVLLILLDDVGFGMCSTFGGPVPTPHLDKLAKNGLKYTRFHTTALCSPTRAALLTGRNHHSVGTGVIIEMGTGYPGYTGIIPQSTALIAEILRDNGYATAMFGKWHNTPEPEISPAGPFDRWPTGLGFDYFYGFNQGETHQYYPTLYRNTTRVPQPKTPEQGYHFTADMTDEAIAWTRNIRCRRPATSPGLSTSARRASMRRITRRKEWREKYKGKFDHGWDKQRELTHAKQLEMGVIPKGTKLTPRPKEIPAWDVQSADAKKVYARLMENYAAYMEYTDHRGRPPDRQPRGVRRTRQHARDVRRRRQRRERRRRPRRNLQRDRQPDRHSTRTGKHAQADRRDRRADQRTARAGRLGLGDERARSNGPSRSPVAFRRHAKSDGRALAEGDQERRAKSAHSSIM